MSQAQKTIKVLVIGGGDDTQAALLDSLGRDVDVWYATDLEDAGAKLIGTEYDFVITSSELFSRERTDFADAIAEASDRDGVGVYDLTGKLIWASAGFLKLTEDAREFTRAQCIESAARTRSRETVRDFSWTSSQDSEFELTVTPILDMDRRETRYVALMRDVTRARAKERQYEAIHRAGRELVRMDTEQVSQLATHERLTLLENKIIKYLHDLMQFDKFSIHLLDKKTNKLEPVLLSGMPQTLQQLDLYASPDGNGIAGYVAHTGKSYNCPDVSRDERYFRALEDACSSLTVPLRLNDEVIGILNVENSRLNAFTSEQCRMAELLGRDIATALHILDLMVTERYTTTGQLGSDVMAEVTAPLNDILTDVESLIEDYLGHDDLRHRLNKITTNVVAIRESIKHTTSPKRGLTGHRPTGVKRSDPIISGKKILVVDDEPMIRETVRDVLQSYGCDVTIAEDGDKAVDQIRFTEFDLVLSDIKMPCRNGYEVFAAAKDANPDTPVILMTGFGYDPNHSIVRARREGLTAVLFKPFKVDQLLGEIRAALHATTG